MKARRQPNRQCDQCGKPYYRCNRIRLWTATNIGHRYGWGKVEQRLCVHCMDAADAQRLAEIYALPTINISVKKKGRG